jgi:hypothetical protein
MLTETFLDCLEAAKDDGFLWAQFDSNGRIYMVSMDKLYSKAMRDAIKFAKLLNDSSWIYSVQMGSLHSNENETCIQLHPFPLPMPIEIESAK